MGETLRALRIETLKRYGMNAGEAEIARLASVWAKEFDANSLLILGRAMEAYDVTPELRRIRVPVLYVLSRTDELFPPSLALDVMGALRGAGVNATYFEIDSDRGHLASGADAVKWAPALREFMARL
jgi:homoserine O-acetyltransferase